MIAKLNLSYADDIRDHGYLNIGRKQKDLSQEVYRQGI